MRVTNKSLMNNYLTNLNRNLLGMRKYQNQLSSGKEVSRPSDDPFAVAKAMRLETSINKNEQYLKNIEDSIGWIDATDSTLRGITDVLQTVRELTVKGANGSNADTDFESIAYEVKQLINQVAQIGNANYDGRYIMGGHKTNEPPFEVASDMLLQNSGDGGGIIRELSQNVNMTINVTGDDLLDAGSTEPLGETLKNIYDRLMSADQTALGDDSLGKLDGHIDRLLGLYAEIGAKSNRLVAAKEKNEAETLNMTELLSKTEDIDIAEKYMEYAMLESVYQASLSVGGKILQSTLLDYLR